MILMLLITPIILFYAKPKYTYNEARNIIRKAEYKNKNIKLVDTGMTVTVVSNPDIFINKVYVIGIEENKTALEYLFNPSTGFYWKIEYGIGEDGKQK